MRRLRGFVERFREWVASRRASSRGRAILRGDAGEPDIGGMPELIVRDAGSIRSLSPHARRGALYTVLDACDEPRILTKVRELGPHRAVSLYRGAAEEDLAAIAPYLVIVDGDLLGWIGSALWSSPWGVFAVSDSALDELRTHFRRFLLVDAPDGDKWYFRFYDPRVLPRFLATCDPAQLTDFFGPVSTFGWTDPETYGVELARQAWFEPPLPARPSITLKRP